MEQKVVFVVVEESFTIFSPFSHFLFSFLYSCNFLTFREWVWVQIQTTLRVNRKHKRIGRNSFFHRSCVGSWVKNKRRIHNHGDDLWTWKVFERTFYTTTDIWDINLMHFDLVSNATLCHYVFSFYVSTLSCEIVEFMSRHNISLLIKNNERRTNIVVLCMYLCVYYNAVLNFHMKCFKLLWFKSTEYSVLLDHKSFLYKVYYYTV